MAKKSNLYLYLVQLSMLLAPVNAFASSCGTELMFLRGTFNSLGTTPMMCENNV